MTTALAVLAATAGFAATTFIIWVVIGLVLALLVYLVLSHIAPGFASTGAGATFVVCLLIGLLLSLD